MAGWNHRFNEHEFKQTLGDGEGQGSLACCSPWGVAESKTQQLNNNKEDEAEFPANPRGLMVTQGNHLDHQHNSYHQYNSTTPVQ